MTNRVAMILEQARREEFHSGNKYGFYQKYYNLITQFARDKQERDDAFAKLREIFQIN